MSSKAAQARGPIHQVMAADHTHLDQLLMRATGPQRIDLAPYDAFRRGLLKHIAMEEKILLPAAQHLNRGEPLAEAARLRLDHGALAALLVPTPTAQIIVALNCILAAHNALEEGANGVYEICDRLTASGAQELIDRLQRAPEVPVAAFNDAPKVMPAARRALARAGYESLLPDQWS